MSPGSTESRLFAPLALALGCSLATGGCKSPRSDAAPAATTADAVEASPSAAAAASASSAALPAVFADGVHDYRGTLGPQPIAAHLVRTAGTVTGAYLYTSIGRPIALQGTVDPGGAVALEETADGVVTGTMRLHPSASGLEGEWVAPRGSKTLPVTLSPGVAPAALSMPIPASQGKDLTGTYRSGSSEIQVLVMDDHTIKTLFDLEYDYQSPAGPSANLGTAEGTARLDGDVATYTSRDSPKCTIRMVFGSGTMKVTQQGEDFDCGFGHRVTASGSYVRVNAAKPKFTSRNAP